MHALDADFADGCDKSMAFRVGEVRIIFGE
jgi:hypothetical protein